MKIWIQVLFLLGVLVGFGCGPDRPRGDPGDEYAMAWVPPERECPEDPEVFDCGGDEIEALRIQESCTEVRNCVLRGRTRVLGDYNSSADIDPAWSRTAEYVAEIRAQAPFGVKFQDCTFVGEGKAPLFISPGVTFTEVKDSTIEGPSRGVMVYLAAETYGSTFKRVVIDGREGLREAVAVDASSHNRFEDCTIRSNIITGGIYLYRNCGEHGVTRQTTPSFNVIVDNTFHGAPIAVYLGSRDGGKSYCDKDKPKEGELEVGSAIDDASFAHDNRVRRNDLNGGVVKEGSGYDNDY